MPPVERSPINPPNASLGTLDARRSMTPAATGSPVRPANNMLKDGDPSAYGGNPSLGRGPSPIHLPDHRFNIENARMPQPPAATMPGQGDVPVDLRVGMPASGMATRDSAKR